MKYVPDESIRPSGPGAPVSLSCRSIPKWRSVAPNCAFAATSASSGPGASGSSTTPCTGWSIAISTRPAAAIASASASICVRSPVMPCWKIVTGQPPAGGVPPLGEPAFGTVMMTGTVTSDVATGAKSVGFTGAPAALFQVLLIAGANVSGSSGSAAVR